jgi:hypothetical protein
MSVLTKRLMTGKELMGLPDDGHRYELVKGELRTILHDHILVATANRPGVPLLTSDRVIAGSKHVQVIW